MARINDNEDEQQYQFAFGILNPFNFGEGSSFFPFGQQLPTIVPGPIGGLTWDGQVPFIQPRAFFFQKKGQAEDQFPLLLDLTDTD